MNIDNMDLRHFKLVNGESILAVVLQESKDTVTIEKPVQLNSKGTGIVRFTYWMPYTDEEYFVLNHKDILIDVSVSAEFKDEYIKLYTEIEDASHDESQTISRVEDLDQSDLDKLVQEMLDPDIKLH